MMTQNPKTTILLAAATLCVSLTGCGTAPGTNEANNTASQLAQQTLDESAEADIMMAQTAFSVNLLREKVRNDPDGNVLISPYSVMQALALTANGTDGNTRMEIEQAFGGVSLDSLNVAMNMLRESLVSDQQCTFHSANAIWVNRNANVKIQNNFQNIAKQIYDAKVTEDAFNDFAVNNINKWFKAQTDGMIPEMLSEPMSETAVMYLCNAASMDAVWREAFDGKEKYTFYAHNMRPNSFEQEVDMMQGAGDEQYLSDENADGFIKSYADGKYAFVAIMPHDGMTPQAYLEQLQPDALNQMLCNPKNVDLKLWVPQFSTSYEAHLIPELQAMGISDVFDFGQADFSKLAEHSDGLFVSEVMQKTQIAVSMTGTKAAAGTDAVVVSSIEEDTVFLTMMRPFIYMIVETDTMMPLFAGVMNEIPQ